MKQYIYGIYQSSDVDDVIYRVMQMVDSIDSLSCGLLAEPDLIHVRTRNTRDAIQYGKTLALEHNCNFLEVNCAHGNGSYKLIGIGR